VHGEILARKGGSAGRDYGQPLFARLPALIDQIRPSWANAGTDLREERTMKKNLRKLRVHRETLTNLSQVVGGLRQLEAAGTHYESICKDLCKEEEGFA
jgi:hypothetical protein